MIGHAVAFTAPVLLLALRDRNPFALPALAGLVFLSGGALRWELRRRGRPGPIGVLLASGGSRSSG